MDFDSNRIISVLNREDAVIGKEYYFADSLLLLKEHVLNDMDYNVLDSIVSLNALSDTAFMLKDSDNNTLGYKFLYPREVKYAPFNCSDWEQLIGKPVHLPDDLFTDSVKLIVAVLKDYVVMYDTQLSDLCPVTYSELLKNYVFMNGGCCGKKIL